MLVNLVSFDFAAVTVDIVVLAVGGGVILFKKKNS